MERVTDNVNVKIPQEEEDPKDSDDDLNIFNSNTYTDESPHIL